MSDCVKCAIDGTDACPRGAGRAVDCAVCSSFIPTIYQLDDDKGYEKGKADGRKEMLDYLERIMWDRYNKINKRGKGYVESFIMWCVKELKIIEEDLCYNETKGKGETNGSNNS